jgi:hypothetical protein
LRPYGILRPFPNPRLQPGQENSLGWHCQPWIGGFVRHWLNFLSTLSVALGTVIYSQAQTEINIAVNPTTVQATNGKLPTNVSLAVYEKECGKAPKLNSFDIQITGGLSVTSHTSGDCVITADVSLNSAQPGAYWVVLRDGDKKPVGLAELAILDTTAGAIPSGLPPQVDVIWGVLSQDVCKSVFGRQVSAYFYCIEVKLGNNTGHPLQLAGVGFKLLDVQNNPRLGEFLQPNTSYASTRAVLLSGSVLDWRNELYHSMQAAGILMGAFTPYFSRPTAKSHFAIAASIASGAALDAFNIIAPDPVVGHLNNLDDESFRDSQVIPNNSQVRTMVFVEKDALTESLESVFCKIYKDDQKCPGGTKTNATDTRKFVEAKSAETIDNSEQKGGWLGGNKFSPFLVKVALGDLVIVGDEIEYLQRVQVQSSSGGTAGVTVSPTKLSFTSQAITTASAAQTATITNSGSGAISGIKTDISGTNKDDFSNLDGSGKPATTCTDPLAAAASCTVSVIFKPTAGTTGLRAATLNVSFTGAGSPPTVSLEGQAAPPPAASTSTLSPDKPSLTFGTQKAKTPSAAQTVTFTNSGNTALSNVSASIVGNNPGDFTKVDCATTVAASGGKCAINVTFTPTVTGDRSATLSITYAGSQQPATVSLSGTGN